MSFDTAYILAGLMVLGGFFFVAALVIFAVAYHAAWKELGKVTRNGK